MGREKRWQAQWANMAGITDSKPLARIRGKDEISGLEKPKKRGSKPNGPT